MYIPTHQRWIAIVFQAVRATGLHCSVAWGVLMGLLRSGTPNKEREREGERERERGGEVYLYQCI